MESYKEIGRHRDDCEDDWGDDWWDHDHDEDDHDDEDHDHEEEDHYDEDEEECEDHWENDYYEECEDDREDLERWVFFLSFMVGWQPMSMLTAYLMTLYVEDYEVLTHWFATMIKWNWVYDSVLGLALFLTAYKVRDMNQTWPSMVALGIHAAGTQYFRQGVLCHLGYCIDSAVEGEIPGEVVNGPLPLDTTEMEEDPLLPPEDTTEIEEDPLLPPEEDEAPVL